MKIIFRVYGILIVDPTIRNLQVALIFIEMMREEDLQEQVKLATFVNEIVEASSLGQTLQPKLERILDIIEHAETVEPESPAIQEAFQEIRHTLRGLIHSFHMCTPNIGHIESCRDRFAGYLSSGSNFRLVDRELRVLELLESIKTDIENFSLSTAVSRHDLAAVPG